MKRLKHLINVITVLSNFLLRMKSLGTIKEIETQSLINMLARVISTNRGRTTPPNPYPNDHAHAHAPARIKHPQIADVRLPTIPTPKPASLPRLYYASCGVSRPMDGWPTLGFFLPE